MFPNGTNQYQPNLQPPPVGFQSYSQPSSGRSSPVNVGQPYGQYPPNFNPNEHHPTSGQYPVNLNQNGQYLPNTNQNGYLGVYPQGTMSRSTPDLSTYPHCNCPHQCQPGQCANLTQPSKAKKLLELGKKIPVGKIAKHLFAHKKGHGVRGTSGGTNYSDGNYDQGYYENDYDTYPSDQYPAGVNQQTTDTYPSDNDQTEQNEKNNEGFFNYVDNLLTDTGNSNEGTSGGDSGASNNDSGMSGGDSGNSSNDSGTSSSDS